jgi:hypothetical protein
MKGNLSKLIFGEFYERNLNNPKNTMPIMNMKNKNNEMKN